MRVILQGFKCYQTQRIFTFSDCTLLQGRSGSGKSTILKGILWCLFGGNKRVYGFKGPNENPNIYVVLELPEYNNITIRRTPKTIEVFFSQNGQLHLFAQGNDADTFITTTFASESLFYATSYIQQKHSCGLISASNQEKAELLHRLTFGEQTTLDVNENPQAYIAQIETKLRLVGGEISKWKAYVNQLSMQYQFNCQNNSESVNLWTQKLPNTLTIQDIDQRILQINKLIEDNLIITSKRQEYDFQVKGFNERLMELKQSIKIPNGDIIQMKTQYDKLHTILIERKSQTDLISEYDHLNKILEPMKEIMSLSKKEQEDELFKIQKDIEEYTKGNEFASKYRFDYSIEGKNNYLNKLIEEINYCNEYPIKYKDWEDECKKLKDECDTHNRVIYEEWKIQFDKIHNDELEYNKNLASITSENSRLIELSKEYKRIEDIIKPIYWIYDLPNRKEKQENIKKEIDQYETNKSIIYKYNVDNVDNHIRKLKEMIDYVNNYNSIKEEWEKRCKQLKDSYTILKEEWIHTCDQIRIENARYDQTKFQIEEENKTKQYKYDAYLRKITEQKRIKEVYKIQYDKYRKDLLNYQSIIENIEKKYIEAKDNNSVLLKSLEEESVWWNKSSPLNMNNLEKLLAQINIAMNQLKCPSCNAALQMKDGKSLIKFELEALENELPYNEQITRILTLGKILSDIEITEKNLSEWNFKRNSLLSPPNPPIEPIFEEEPVVFLDLISIPTFIKKQLPNEPSLPNYPLEPVKLFRDLESINNEIGEVSKITTMNNDYSKIEYENFIKATQYESLKDRYDTLKEYSTPKFLEMPLKITFDKPVQPTNKQPILPPEVIKPKRGIYEISNEKQIIEHINFLNKPINQIRDRLDMLKRIPDCNNNWIRLCEIKPIIENLKIESDTGSLQKQYESLAKDIDEYKNLEYAYNNTKEQMSILETKINELISPYPLTLKELIVNKEILENNKLQDTRLKKAADDYNRLLAEYGELSKYEQVLKGLIERETNISQVLKLVKELESQAVEDTVTAINNEANKILEQIIEEPMSIQLRTHRELKTKDTTKLQVNILISFFGADDLQPNDLSGGEQDRLSLALTLAMAKVSDSPFLLLDECMSSIDNTLRGRCLKILKSMFPNKTIINVCHEAIQGHHDSIVDLCCDI